MSKSLPRTLWATALLAILTGCAGGTHAESEPPPEGKVYVCRFCYDQISKVRRTHPRGYAGERTLLTHMCPDCKSELSVYAEGSTLKAKCATCAPDGVDCDLCLPRPDGR